MAGFGVENDTLMTDPEKYPNFVDDMEIVMVFNFLHTKSMPIMCAGEGVLISQSRKTHAPILLTDIYIPSHVSICALDRSATHNGHNIS